MTPSIAVAGIARPGDVVILTTDSCDDRYLQHVADLTKQLHDKTGVYFALVRSGTTPSIEAAP